MLGISGEFSLDRDESSYGILEPIPISSKQLDMKGKPLLCLEPPDTANAQRKAVGRIARQVTLQPHAEMQAMSTTPVSGLSIIEPAQLNIQFSHLHVTQEVIKPSQSQTMEVLMSNFGLTLQNLPKTYDGGVRRSTAHTNCDLPYESADRTLDKITSFPCQNQMIAKVHY